MKILVIVHVEPDFDKHIPLDLPRKIANYGKLFDRVLVIESASELSGTEPYPELVSFYENWSESWVWGLDTNWIHESWEENRDYIICKKSLHDGATIYDWMHELPKDAKYYLCGGHRNECLQDIIEIWETLGYKFKVIESLTYG